MIQKKLGKLETRFVYVQNQAGDWFYHSEYQGFGKEADDQANDTAKILIERGHRVAITSEYAGTATIQKLVG